MPESLDDFRKSSLFRRRSIRRFKPSMPEDWMIRAMLEAAMNAPTACNQMPFEFIVVKDKAVLSSLQKALPLARLSTAPVAFVVISKRSVADKLHPCKAFVEQDLAAVSLQLCIAATELGLGSVWCGVHPAKVMEAAARKVLGIPGDVMVLSVIPAGYPDEEKPPNDKWFPERVHEDRY